MRVVFDTNLIFSAVLFGGIPRAILEAAIENKFDVISSAVLMAELLDTLKRKSPLTLNELQLIEEEITNLVEISHPRQNIKAVRDEDDNRVLEVAVEGNCDYIVTGDQDLLTLKKYKKIMILTPKEFLEVYERSHT